MNDVNNPLFEADSITVFEAFCPDRAAFLVGGIGMLTAEEAQQLGLILLSYAWRNGMKTTLAKPAVIAARQISVFCNGGLVLFADEICGHGTCCRPPKHAGQCDQFDGPQSPDSVKPHLP